MRISIIGSGYVGLVSGVCLADKGHHVVCVDINSDVVSALNSGSPPIHERGLKQALSRVLESGRFSATTDLDGALDATDGVIIAVGTPTVDGEIDLSQIRDVARSIGKYLADCEKFLPVVVKSTVIPGTTDTLVKQEIEEVIRTHGQNRRFGLGMNPEFLREGDAVSDFMDPDRIVIGYEDERTRTFLEAVYAPWDCDKLFVNTRTAELIKYANNALLALQISAVNELANLAALIGGIDIMQAMAGVHLDKRWNPLSSSGERLNPGILSYLIPGCGFGGSCFPKDVKALATLGKSRGHEMEIFKAALNVNERQPSQVVSILLRHFGDLSAKRVLVLGLAFKPGTDDVRESASLKIVSELLLSRCVVRAHDPIATANFAREFSKNASESVQFIDQWECELTEVDIVVVATSWDDYKCLPSYADRDFTIFDARGMFKPTDFPGRTYLSIGHQVV